MAYPVFDNHVHLQRKGRFTDAVKEFERKGGTGFMLVALPPDEGLLNDDFFLRMYDEGVSIKKEAEEAADVDALLAIGPYPVTLLGLAGQLGIEQAEERMVRGVELAGKFIMEGKANAIGEVGRPHFPVSEELLAASNRIMEACFRQAKSAGCSVILHTEDPSPSSLAEIAGIADAGGMERGRVIKHHCTDLIYDDENSGIFPSVKATRELVLSAAKKGKRFVMETDYIDDPARPGAVLGIATVPKRTRELLGAGIFSEEDIWKVNYENPAKLYGKEWFRKTA